MQVLKKTLEGAEHAAAQLQLVYAAVSGLSSKPGIDSWPISDDKDFKIKCFLVKLIFLL